jgi:hypothetical protein
MATDQGRAIVRRWAGSTALSPPAGRPLARAALSAVPAPLAVGLSAGVGLLGLGWLLARRRGGALATGPLLPAPRPRSPARLSGAARGPRGFYAAEVSVVRARVVGPLGGA